ncbi:hypothetical protein WS71_19430 [Burkholderia mayonis]|uniref:Uncharacterized protein n=1 Tax=Burkholderia mayonis TaxID=1385591 RepID=A0A1B4G0T5_9BURK|nr:hypothetical protein WS71_19430 [Burkholderia mayonis]KVE47163.1 hypothetical protein WS71_19460 [Burkholderia mayonis]
MKQMARARFLQFASRCRMPAGGRWPVGYFVAMQRARERFLARQNRWGASSAAQAGTLAHAWK